MIEMYDFFEQLWFTEDMAEAELPNPAELLNKEMLSPFTYAASLGRKAMFQHLLTKKGIIMEWQVLEHRLPLHDDPFLGQQVLEHHGVAVRPTSLSLHPLDELDYIPDW
eukprot:TRINITY_DN10997_c0_g1_i2.p3 TRINITY_DN10997_c0_g1~~TRINITY_DN10997_c0_g1_i2.p3  ORF type:complete len:109 (+),score=51.11 TRINITY_DN10997_c0_g1_i2:555-881(+)